MSDHQGLHQWVTPRIEERDLHRMWGVIRDAERRRTMRWLAWGAAFATLVAVILGIALVTRPSTVDATIPRVARLTDGSTVVAEVGTSLSVDADEPNHVAVRLHGGRATFEVTKRPSRTFVVEAAGVVVSVVGTRFTVEETGSRVGVSVERGVVQVSRGTQVVRLEAGQTWSSAALDSAPHEAEPEPEVDVAPVPAAPRPPVRSPSKRAAAASRTPAPSDTLPSGSTTSAPPPVDSFQEALEARRARRPADAAKAFERFLASAPHDARVGVAAFELARLRMDSLGDLAGAAEAFERALREPESAFREEALSGLVRARSRLGDRRGCELARARYESEFPQGAYLTSVRTACRPQSE